MTADGSPRPQEIPAHLQGDWLVITAYEHKVVAAYDTREEAETAVTWLREWWPLGPEVEYCHA